MNLKTPGGEDTNHGRATTTKGTRNGFAKFVKRRGTIWPHKRNKNGYDVRSDIANETTSFVPFPFIHKQRGGCTTLGRCSSSRASSMSNLSDYYRSGKLFRKTLVVILQKKANVFSKISRPAFSGGASSWFSTRVTVT